MYFISCTPLSLDTALPGPCISTRLTDTSSSMRTINIKLKVIDRRTLFDAVDMPDDFDPFVDPLYPPS